MKTEALPTGYMYPEREFADSAYRREHRRWVRRMLGSTVTASITGIFGLALAGASLLHVIDSRSLLSFIGTILLALTFPLLVFSAHCLDKIEDANRAHRVASYKQIVFGESENAGFNATLRK